MQRRDFVVSGITVAILAGCGGGGVTDAPRAQASAASPLGDLGRAIVTDVTLDGRKHALSAAAQSQPTANQLFDWAETLFKDQSGNIFPKGPATGTGEHQGVTYLYRGYPTGYYLGVAQDGGVYVLAPDGRLEQFGVLADYTCQVLPIQCGGTVAGAVAVFTDHHLILPNFRNGKITYLGGKDGKAHEVSLGDVARVVWNSSRVGGGMLSTAFGVPAVDGTLRINGVPNNDRGYWTIWTKAGTELWFDVGSAAGWGLAGDIPAKVVSGQVEYGANGYQLARVDFQGGALTLDFGHNGLAGFSKPLVPGDLLFVWMSDTEGWFLDSTKRGYLAFNQETGKHFVSIPGIACGQRGTVAIYRAKSKAGSTITWEDVPYAWFGVPTWAAGPKVTFEVKRLLHEEQHSIVLGC